jgi:metallothionein
MKCECIPCTCEVERQQSIERNGKYYCAEACASDHPSGQGVAPKGCGHEDCPC